MSTRSTDSARAMRERSIPGGAPADKPCATCGRPFAWRSAWARNWDQIRHCSEACRRRRPGPTDLALEDAIRELCRQRPRGATICPSEAARRVDPANEGALWEPARRAARRMMARGELEILQDGRVVDDSGAVRGPIRLRLRDPG
jgi:hypothetical protein